MKDNISLLLLTTELPISGVVRFLNNKKIERVKIYNASNAYVSRLCNKVGLGVDISRVSRSEFDFKELLLSRGRSYEYIERIYQYMLINNKVPIKWAMRYYKDYQIERVFKKELINQISRWLEIEYLAKRYFENSNRVSILTDTINYDISQMFCALYSREYPFFIYRENTNFLLIVFTSYVKFIFVPSYIFSKFRFISFKDKLTSKADVAIRLHGSIRGVSNSFNMDGCDALVPHLKSKEVSHIFVAESMPDSKILFDINNNDSKIIDMDKALFSNMSITFLYSVAREQVVTLIRSFYLFFSSSIIFYNLMSKLLFDYYKWTYFCKTNQINWYCSTNNEGMGHITRNIILHNYGVKTLHYAQSWSDYYFLGSGDFRIPDRAFSLYHTKAYLCKRQREYDKSQISKSEKRIITGVLSNTHIVNHASKNPLFSLSSNNSKRIISVYTSSASDSTFNSEKDLIYFLYLIQEASKDIRFRDYIFAIKFKKPITEGNHSSKELIDAYGAIRANKNIIEVDPKINALFLLSVSDFVISMAFTGPSIDALYLRIPACFVSIQGKADNSIFSKCNGLIISDIDEMYDSLNYFSNLSNEKFDSYYLENLPLGCVKNIEKTGYEIIADYFQQLP